MERRTIARALRALRRRKNWSQRELGSRLGISKSEMSRWEAGALEHCSLPELERWATALSAYAFVDLRVQGERPLTDARHAALQNWLASELRRFGWIVVAEATFNHYGDRGSIDLLAFHPASGVLLVVEVKSRLLDVQDVLARLDVKRRVALKLAEERGWTPTSTMPALVFHEDSTTRRRIAAHDALFAGFSLRGRSANAWLRHPKTPAPAGILLMVTPT